MFISKIFKKEKINHKEFFRKILGSILFLIIFIIFLEIIFSIFIFLRQINKSYRNLEFLYFQSLENEKAFSQYILRSQKLGPFWSQPYYEIPTWRPESAPLFLEAKSAISLLIKNDGKEKILYQKNRKEVLPIASITKLMTAYVALKYLKPTEIITFDQNAIEKEGEVGKYRVGESFKLYDLLHSVLMESSNDAAYAISQKIGEEKFVELMNSEAKLIGLSNTLFFNATGLPLEQATSTANLSTVQDLANFGKFLLKERPQILEISAKKEYNLYLADTKKFHHKIYNNNILLKEKDFQILGSKTGSTALANKCLFLIIKAPNDLGVIINVILGSDDHFKETKQLIDWIISSYKWE